MEGLAGRLHQVQDQIHKACAACGRDPATVRLVLASKTQDAAAVLAAHRAGAVDFAENYAQELRDKRQQLQGEDGLRWHFIGPLQRNKVKLVVGAVELIHTIDSPALCAAVAAQARRLGTPQRCLIEVNLGDEPQKGGCAEADLPALLEAFAAAEGAARCVGLMCIPPPTEDPEGARPYFRRLSALRAALAARAHVEPTELSMGMSHDFAIAIEEGATLVRVGTAVFGPRPPAHPKTPAV